MTAHDMTADQSQATAPWWRGAVIYQVYPRSFMDSDGDGVGDLRGITRKLDYIKKLGADAVWISPFFTSPMKDFGYDVADYRGVDPLFGTLADFDALLAAAHQRGLKIIIDMVLSHTSDHHPWFIESRTDRTNARADWYVWADPRPDGGPPSNWQAVFGGSSWEFDMRRGQYYLHNFLKEQPDLNLHNPAVRAALMDECRFWLARGVDGIRLDAVTQMFHNPALPDNPPNPNPLPAFFNVTFPVPFTMQIHQHDVQIPPLVAFGEEIRAMLDEFPDRMAVAEVGGEDGVQLGAHLTDGPKRLHTAYNFSLISGTRPSAQYIRRAVQAFEATGSGSWPSWAFSNHDVRRVMSRWGGTAHEHSPALARLLVALLGSLRGTVFLYQGEELGLTDAPVTFDQIQDPWGKVLYPSWQGRDGCRTPMPWTPGGKNAGFSKGKATWLPIPADHRRLSVAQQEKDHGSPLHFTRKFLNWRTEQNVLKNGGIGFYDDDNGDDVLAFTRHNGGEGLLCVFNMTPDTRSFDTGYAGWAAHSTFRFATQDGTAAGPLVTLPPFGFYFGAFSS